MDAPDETLPAAADTARPDDPPVVHDASGVRTEVVGLKLA
jgi:hypothetical protein